MPQSAKTPHRAARPGGDVFLSHADYLDYLYDCAASWDARGERRQANEIRNKARKLKQHGEGRCQVCLLAEQRERFRNESPVIVEKKKEESK